MYIVLEIKWNFDQTVETQPTAYSTYKAALNAYLTGCDAAAESDVYKHTIFLMTGVGKKLRLETFIHDEGGNLI